MNPSSLSSHRFRFALVGLLLCVLSSQGLAASKSIRVFVALCDNETQGIVPVGEKIGDGNKPDENLYWGCADGLPQVFKKSGEWTLQSLEKDLGPHLMRRAVFKHKTKDLLLTADAFRGSDIRRCLIHFEIAAGSGRHDLVVFIGHNGLMDFELPAQLAAAKNKTDAMVLCCQSEKYFKPRLEALQCRPVLLTDQFMYPGAFILRDAIGPWERGQTIKEIRKAAGRAYAKNQSISERAATGVFADL